VEFGLAVEFTSERYGRDRSRRGALSDSPEIRPRAGEGADAKNEDRGADVYGRNNSLRHSFAHGTEAFIWAMGFRLLHALPDKKSALLYSLSAMTTFGHSGATLENHWQLMGALEALNGWILFGLSTAFLYAMVQDAWSRLDNPLPPKARLVRA
jgi:hypothetical protein